MNVDIERMGDQCVNIAHLGREFLERADGHDSGLPDLKILQEMGKSVRQMIRDALDSFVNEDADKAKTVLMMDDEVDKKKTKVFKEFSAAIKTNPLIVESALDVIMMAKNLERLGDHATNIAEDVIYVSTGKDVRHGGR
jgi:phosphate transport system protein